MSRQKLTSRLVAIRQFKLASALGHLKSRIEALRGVERAGKRALGAASETVSSLGGLPHLTAIGDARLKSRRVERNLKGEVAAAGNNVSRARKLCDAAQEVLDVIHEEKRRERERTLELEAENFLSWKGLPRMKP